MEVTDIELQACPHCGGDGVIEDEGGWCVYVTCCDCGAHTAQVDYHSPEERLDAAKRAAFVWNIGKVVSSHPVSYTQRLRGFLVWPPPPTNIPKQPPGSGKA
mgnify:CR=1 FL=1